MRRLKKSIKEKQSLKRFDLRVSKINTKFTWNNCCWCDYEFRKEEGYEITMSENFNINNPSETYYVCNKCSSCMSKEDMTKIWEESKLYKVFKSRSYDE